MIFSDITINYKFNGIGYTLSIVAGRHCLLKITIKNNTFNQ